jgi:hypothetical protein
MFDRRTDFRIMLFSMWYKLPSFVFCLYECVCFISFSCSYLLYNWPLGCWVSRKTNLRYCLVGEDFPVTFTFSSALNMSKITLKTRSISLFVIVDLQTVLSRIWLTNYGVWIGNWIYLTLTERNCKYYYYYYWWGGTESLGICSSP